MQEQNEFQPSFADPTQPMEAEERTFYRNSTRDLVSRVAYLIGVPKRMFENEHEPPQLDIYDRLDKEKNARIIRNLCLIRTAIQRNFKYINEGMRFEHRSILTMPEYVPVESINQLELDGVRFIKKSSIKLYQHIIEINRVISDRINNCKPLFPLWLNWEYIRDLIVMPDGLTEAGTKAAADRYYANRSDYPYQVYINWVPAKEGNVLYNDKRFATLLYEWHNDRFSEYSRVSDVSSYVKGSIYDFLEESEKVVMVVDCENSDPYRLCATLRNLDEQYTRKISRIILFNDVHAASAWKMLEDYTDLTVEHIMIERVKQNKSLVDITLTARACEEHYRNNVDSFLIVSSDSDYWGLITSMPHAKFLVMVKREKCGIDMKKALADSEIFYCFIDDFYSGNAEEIRRSALFKALNQTLSRAIHLNVNEMFDNALHATRISMTPAERQQFYEKHIRQMSLAIDPEGNVTLELKR